MRDDAIVLVHDLDGVCQYASPACAAALGRRAEELVGHRTAGLVPPEDRPALLDAAFELATTDARVARSVVRVLHRDGHHVTLQCEHEPMRSPEGELRGFRTTADVVPDMPLRAPGTARPDANAALYDASGAATPALLDDRLQVASQRHRRQGEPFAVLWVLLHVDDPDASVTRIAIRRLLKLVRRTDTVACFDPVDLAVICAGATRDVAITVAERAVRSLAEPVRTPAGRLELRATIGVATASVPHRDPQALLRAARDACCDPARAHQGAVRIA